MAERDYTITSQLQTRENRNGQLVDVYEVHYQGPNGITGWVRVPVATASPDVVDELIRRQLDAQLAIGQLGTA